MTASERAELAALRDLPEDRPDGDDDWEMMDGVLDGTEHMDASHAGGEFETVFQGMEEDILSTSRRMQVLFIYHLLAYLRIDSYSRRRVPDHRTRADHTEWRTQSFKAQMDSLVDAYISWSAASAEMGFEGGIVPPDAEVQGSYPTRVVDVFSESHFFSFASLAQSFFARRIQRQY